MSIVENNVITRLNYCHKDIGRKMKISKQYHQWEFTLNGVYHKIELFHSKISGNKKLFVDGDYILKEESYYNNFKYNFEIDGKLAQIKQKKLNEYDLFICGKSFEEMKKEENDGINQDIIEQKIEELKRNNEYNNPIPKKRNVNYEEHDFEMEEEEDEEENEDETYRNNNNNNDNKNFNLNSNLNNNRDDDDFYKKDGNNFDFSDTAFEKNKKILENFDFFGDDNISNNNNINNNFGKKRNNNTNTNNIRNNNFNFQKHFPLFM